MVYIAQYNGTEVVGFSKDSTFYPLEYKAKLEELGTISYKSKAVLDAEAKAESELKHNNAVYKKINRLEKTLIRPLRELAIDQANQTAKDRIVAVEAEVVALRDSLV